MSTRMFEGWKNSFYINNDLVAFYDEEGIVKFMSKDKEINLVDKNINGSLLPDHAHYVDRKCLKTLNKVARVLAEKRKRLQQEEGVKN